MRKNHLNVPFQVFRHSATGLLAWACILYFITTGLFSCATVKAVNESPTRIGVGAEMAPGLQLGNGGSSGHLLLGYSWIPFKGGGGHNNFFQGGLQYRYAFSKTCTGRYLGRS